MARDSGTCVFVNGKRYDLAAPMAVEALLRFRKGRRALSCWLNDHKNSTQYSLVYDRVAGAVLRRQDIFKPLTAAATVATCLFAPAPSLPLSIPQDAAKQCVICHRSAAAEPIKQATQITQTKQAAPEGAARTAVFTRKLTPAPHKLTFFSLGSAGYGISKIGKGYVIEGERSGIVAAKGVLFRNESGARLRCEWGSTVPRGASVVLGTKAYPLTRLGTEWTMRNLLSLNGVPVAGEVFIAEYYVAHTPQKEPLLLLAKAPATAEARPIVAALSSVRPIAPAAASPAPPAALAATPARPAPHSAAVAHAVDNAVTGVAAGSVTVEQKGDLYEASSRFSGLTINHVFRGSGGMTVHEASLAAYPELSFMEVFNVPLEEVIKNVSKYSRGIDHQLGKNIIAFINNRLAPMFGNNRLRRLPSPDSRLVLGIKISGADDYFKQIYLGTSAGEWVPLNDDLLIGILHSDPVTSYAEHAPESAAEHTPQ